mgnify:CR=1 FL=1
MLQINLCQPSSIILADLQQRPIFEKFLEAALLAGGIEIKWEYDFKWDEAGYLRSCGKRYTGVREVDPCTGRPPENERREQQV